MTAWQFLRLHFVRIVIGAVLVAAAYSVMSVHATYQREKRIARKIDSLGGKVHFEFRGPIWIPQSVGEELPFLHRIIGVELDAADEVARFQLNSENVSLYWLAILCLNGAQINDVV